MTTDVDVAEEHLEAGAAKTPDRLYRHQWALAVAGRALAGSARVRRGGERRPPRAESCCRRRVGRPTERTLALGKTAVALPVRRHRLNEECWPPAPGGEEVGGATTSGGRGGSWRWGSRGADSFADYERLGWIGAGGLGDGPRRRAGEERIVALEVMKDVPAPSESEPSRFRIGAPAADARSGSGRSPSSSAPFCACHPPHRARSSRA